MLVTRMLSRYGATSNWQLQKLTNTFLPHMCKVRPHVLVYASDRPLALTYGLWRPKNSSLNMDD